MLSFFNFTEVVFTKIRRRRGSPFEITDMPESSQNAVDDAKVSIIIPFFNREEFLAEAIESVIAQTYQNWELILIDDGSTDRSHQIASRFVHQHADKVSIYAHENHKNRGASSSRNLGIKNATGEFITFLDSDDIFLPTTLEIEMAAFRSNPTADAVCGTLQYWFSWAEKIDLKERDFIVNLGLPTETLYEPPTLLIHNLRAGGRKPGMGCTMLTSEFARRFQMFQDDFAYVSEDQIFWAKVSLNAKIYVLHDCLTKYRQHSHSSVAVVTRGSNVTLDQEKFSEWLEEHLAENGIDDAEIQGSLKIWQKEIAYRKRYGRILDLYQRIFPFHLRYRIRDVIVRWRSSGK